MSSGSVTGLCGATLIALCLTPTIGTLHCFFVLLSVAFGVAAQSCGTECWGLGWCHLALLSLVTLNGLDL